MTQVASKQKAVVLEVALRPAGVALHRPLHAAYGTVTSRPGLHVTVTGQGVTGRGEVLPLPDFGTGTLEQVRAALEAWPAPGAPASVEDLPALLTSLDAVPAARFAAEMALLEWLAVRQGVPVARLLAEDALREVPCGALIDGDDAAALARAAAQAVAEGFCTLKVKVGVRPLAEDAQRLLAVRRAVGKGVRLRIDANGAWSEASARSALRGLESLELELCEQPVRAHDVAALSRLRRAVPVPVAADESVVWPDGPQRLLERDPEPATQVLVLKPAFLGGVVRAVELGRLARQYGVGCYATHLLDGPLGRAAALHAAAALGDTGYAHGLSVVDGPSQNVPLAPVAGVVRVPDVPGWGV